MIENKILKTSRLNSLTKLLNTCKQSKCRQNNFTKVLGPSNSKLQLLKYSSSVLQTPTTHSKSETLRNL